MSTAPVAFTASQLEDQVRNLLSDNINFATTTPDGKDPQTWSPQQVYDALNYAIKQYCVSTNATWVETVVPLTINGIATIPTDYLEVNTIVYPASAKNVVTTDGTPNRYGGDYILSPTSVSMASLPYAVRVPQCIQMSNGKVLISGGQNQGYYQTAPTKQCCIYGPDTGISSITGPMSTERSNHRLVKLPSGDIMAIGGGDSWSPLLSTEVYSVSGGTWSAGPAITRQFYNGSAITLSDGTIVLFDGGHADIIALAPGGSAWTTVGSFSGHTLTPSVVGQGGQQATWAKQSDGTILVSSFRDNRVTVPPIPSGLPFVEMCIGGIYSLSTTRTNGVVTSVVPVLWAESSQWHSVQPVAGYPYGAPQVYGDWISTVTGGYPGTDRCERYGNVVLVPREDGSVVASGGFYGDRISDRLLRFTSDTKTVNYTYPVGGPYQDTFKGRILIDGVVCNPDKTRQDDDITLWSSDGLRIYNGLGKQTSGNYPGTIYSGSGLLRMGYQRAGTGVANLGDGIWLVVGGYNGNGSMSAVEKVTIY